jgi:hypothetical protein
MSNFAKNNLTDEKNNFIVATDGVVCGLWTDFCTNHRCN